MMVSEISPKDFAGVWERENLGLYSNPQLASWVGAGMLFLKVEVSQGVEAYFTCFSYTSWGIRFVINPPGMAYCGFEMVTSTKDAAISKVLKADALRGLTEYFLKSYPHAIFDLRLAPSEVTVDHLPGLTVTQPTHSYLDLTVSETDLFAQLSSRRKRNIKKLNKGYVAESSPSTEAVMKLLRYTFEKSKTQHLKPFYLQGLEGKSPFLKANLVSLEGRNLATNVVAYDKATAYYFLGGIDPAVNDSNAGTIAMWNAIVEARNAGIKTFNFCGSSIPSISTYFKSFGGAEARLIQLQKRNKLVEKLKKLKGKF